MSAGPFPQPPHQGLDVLAWPEAQELAIAVYAAMVLDGDAKFRLRVDVQKDSHFFMWFLDRDGYPTRTGTFTREKIND